MDGFGACFEGLEDPRTGNAGRHQLLEILMIALCTVLCGGQTAVDMAVPVEVAQWLADTIDGATLDIIDASGHLPHMTAADEVTRILERRLIETAP